jgi:hypothetical protein
MAITVNELIGILETIKSEGNGDAKVLYEKDGGMDGYEVITDVFIEGYTDRGWIEDLDEILPDEKVTNILIIHCDGQEEFSPEEV